MEKKKYFQFDPDLFVYRVKRFQSDYVVLSKSEIDQLLNLNITNPTWQRIIDLFVCNCYMSLRYSDLHNFEMGELYQDDDGDYIYKKINQKTKSEINIVILPISLEILKKYDFILPKYSDQYFNRELKKILKHYDLFNETIKKNDLRNNKNVITIHKKRDLISSHTCRRSFISNAVSSGVGLDAIMATTGHQEIATLNKYVKKRYNKEQIALMK